MMYIELMCCRLHINLRYVLETSKYKNCYCIQDSALNWSCWVSLQHLPWPYSPLRTPLVSIIFTLDCWQPYSSGFCVLKDAGRHGMSSCDSYWNTSHLPPSQVLTCGLSTERLFVCNSCRVRLKLTISSMSWCSSHLIISSVCEVHSIIYCQY